MGLIGVILWVLKPIDQTGVQFPPSPLMDITGLLNQKTRTTTITSTRPICKKCGGDLDYLQVLTGGQVSGENDVDENGTLTLYFNSKSVNLYSCKNEKCKWYGLLTQITGTKKTINTIVSGGR